MLEVGVFTARKVTTAIDYAFPQHVSGEPLHMCYRMIRPIGGGPLGWLAFVVKAVSWAVDLGLPTNNGLNSAVKATWFAYILFGNGHSQLAIIVYPHNIER